MSGKSGHRPGSRVSELGGLAVRLLAVWAVIFAAVVGVGLLITGPLKQSLGASENDFEMSLASHRTAALNSTATVIAVLGGTIFVIVAGLLVAFGSWWWFRSSRPLWFVLLGVIGEVPLYYVSSDIVGRHRPPVRLLDTGLDPTHSFPSGHVASSTVLFGSVAILLWIFVLRRGGRWLVLPLLLVPLMVAAARLYQGVHHPTDVLASVVFASVWVASLTRLVLRPPAPRPA